MSDIAPNPVSQINLDEVIGDNVHQLMWRARESQTSLALLMGLGQSSLSLKMRGRRPWFAGEIDFLARHFGISRDDLFTPDVGVDGWAPSGSNRRPKDYRGITPDEFPHERDRPAAIADLAFERDRRRPVTTGAVA